MNQYSVWCQWQTEKAVFDQDIVLPVVPMVGDIVSSRLLPCLMRVTERHIEPDRIAIICTRAWKGPEDDDNTELS